MVTFFFYLHCANNNRKLYHNHSYFIFSGKYYLVDAGYPQMKGFLGPYKGERYHLSHFRKGEEPTGHK